MLFSRQTTNNTQNWKKKLKKMPIWSVRNLFMSCRLRTLFSFIPLFASILSCHFTFSVESYNFFFKFYKIQTEKTNCTISAFYAEKTKCKHLPVLEFIVEIFVWVVDLFAAHCVLWLALCGKCAHSLSHYRYARICVYVFLQWATNFTIIHYYPMIWWTFIKTVRLFYWDFASLLWNAR